MKAVVWTAYGSPDVLQLQDVPKPIPKDHEVLIKIVATTVTSGDCEQRSLKLPFWQRLPMQTYIGLKKPLRISVLGMELAGKIESVGKDVKCFKEGDSVFGATGFENMGTYAEYICLPEEPDDGALAIKPSNISYEEATALPVGGLEALYFLRQGNIQSEQTVLINGAGGTIGTFAVQLAKYQGAEVTSVDSTAKLDMLRSIGSDQVMDYTQDDFTQKSETYDFILDMVGKHSIADVLRSLKPNGCYLIANPRLSYIVRGRWASMISNKNVVLGATDPQAEDLEFLKELIRAGKLKTIIDRHYTLEQIPEAHRYVETGQKVGHVVINIVPN